MTIARSRKYIKNKRKRSVRMRFDDNPDHDIVISDIRKFGSTGRVVQLSTGELIAVEPDEPQQLGRDYVYTVKLVDQQ